MTQKQWERLKIGDRLISNDRHIYKKNMFHVYKVKEKVNGGFIVSHDIIHNGEYIGELTSLLDKTAIELFDFIYQHRVNQIEIN